jgi:hypothetical protein
MKSRVLTLAFLLLASTTLFAQTAARHDKVRRLLDLTGAEKLGLQVMDAMTDTFKGSVEGVPDEFWRGIRNKIKPGELVDMLVPIYEKHLTDADLDALIAFYSSPAGRRYVEKQPLIAADSMKAGQEFGARLAREVIAELKAKGYAPK